MTDLLQPPEEKERPRIDPRMARRWIEARREEGRRRLQLLIIAGSLLAVTALFVLSLFTPAFEVRHVRVTIASSPAIPGVINAPATTPASVRALAGLGGRPLMINVDASASTRKLDANPWLGAARVTRKWPSTVTIAVQTRYPVAVVTTPSGSYAEIDSTGRVLANLTSLPTTLPLLLGIGAAPSPGGWVAGTAGPSASPQASASALVDMSAASDGADMPTPVAAALAVVDSLPSALRADVLSITASPNSALSLVLAPPNLAAGTVTVTLGDGSQLQAKVTALVSLVDQNALAGVTSLDLTVPTRPAAK